MMDRSFLSDRDVIAAARGFVCIRLATYESAEEAKILAAVAVTRSGFLENTVFAILGPDGKTPLVRGGRSPHEAFPGPPSDAVKRLATGLGDLSRKYPGSAEVGGRLPYLVDLRRAMNVAACEIQPLAIVYARTEAAQRKLEEKLLPGAWGAETRGRLAYVASRDPSEAAKYIDGKLQGDGVYVVQPDAFGEKGKLLSFSADGNPAVLADGLKKFTGESKDSRRHIDEGMRKGLDWKTEIPVTDPMAPKR